MIRRAVWWFFKEVVLVWLGRRRWFWSKAIWRIAEHEPETFWMICRTYRAAEFKLPGIDFEKRAAGIGEATFVKRTDAWHLRKMGKSA